MPVVRSPIVESLESRRLMAGDGLSTVYFDNTNFTGAHGAAVTPVGDDYIEALPPGVVGDFSTRWAGQLSAIEGGNNTFQIPVNGGVKLWVNDKLLINQPTPQVATHTSAPIALKARTNYHIAVEYISPANGDEPGIALNWTRPGQTTPQQIPFESYSSDNRAFPADAGLFDVRAFSALGDGINDDAQEIQAALDAARTSPWGGIVYLPSGTYCITDQINFGGATNAGSQNVVMRGQNRDNVVLKLDNADPDYANSNAPRAVI